MGHIFSNRKFNFLLLILAFIGITMILSSCITISPDTKDKIKSEAQDLRNQLNQTVNQLLPQLENGAKQADVQLSPPIATATRIWADTRTYYPQGYLLSVSLKPTNLAIADKEYAVDLYEKRVFREQTTVSWNQPELNVLKEQVVSFHSNQQEYDAYSGQDISHIFSVKVHE
ncbi:MAG: hypothetical protein WCD72_08335 [Dehalococcoidia bacterium]